MSKALMAAAALLALAASNVAAQTPPEAGAQTAPKVGLIAIGLNVADMDRSMKFYVDGLGMQPLSRNERDDVVEQFLGYPAMPYPPLLELIARKSPTETPPPRTTFKIVLSVDNAEAINEQLKRAGFSPPPVRMNPITGAGFFFVQDPDGYSIEIVQRPPTPPRG